MASKTTGQPRERIIGREVMSTTSRPYPMNVPRSQSIRPEAPLERHLSTTCLMSPGDRNCAFLTLMGFPVADAASSRSVWRQRKAGICSTSTTRAVGSACHDS